MKHLILGTAGHIDHGKTRLVKALTGIDTDTLQEEKRRGISINLGHAFYDLPGGTRIGVIDVPGHMRFIKTMLAGVTGIDFVLFVVAADDAVMPQTREHFDILRLLSVRSGILVMTKIDLVDKDTADLVEEEIRELVKGSFLENALLVRVSAETGEGVEALKKAVEETALSLPERKESPLFRMPVDRSFSVAGFGTVVTGTVFSGSAVKGEKVVVLPAGLSTEVRGVEVHKNKTDKAFSGQRAALNLSGVSKQEVKRGDVVCAPGYFVPTLMVDATLELLDQAQLLRQGERVKFHLGTNEVNGRIYFLEDDSLVQIRLSEEVVLVKGDRYIIRNQEASRTLGGGVVLDAHPQKHKRRKNLDTAVLRALTEAGIRQQALLELGKARSLLSAGELCARLTARRKNVQEALEILGGESRALLLKTGSEIFAIATDKYQTLVQSLKAPVLEFHHNQPLLKSGIGKPEIRQKCAELLGEKETEAAFAPLWESLTQGNVFKEVDGTLALKEWEVVNTEEDARLEAAVYHMVDSAGFETPDRKETLSKFKEKRAALVFDAMLKSGRLVKVEECFFSERTIEKGAQLLRTHLESRKEGTVSELRQILNTSRKYAIPLLNYYEASGLLIRRGDVRVLA